MPLGVKEGLEGAMRELLEAGHILLLIWHPPVTWGISVCENLWRCILRIFAFL